MIKVRATKDGQKLYVKEISGEHNHDLSEVKIIIFVAQNGHNYYTLYTHIGSISSYAKTKAS